MFLLKHFLINITIIMDVYMYKYNCPSVGYSQGLRNMNTVILLLKMKSSN